MWAHICSCRLKMHFPQQVQQCDWNYRLPHPHSQKRWVLIVWCILQSASHIFTSIFKNEVLGRNRLIILLKVGSFFQKNIIIFCKSLLDVTQLIAFFFRAIWFQDILLHYWVFCCISIVWNTWMNEFSIDVKLRAGCGDFLQAQRGWWRSGTSWAMVVYCCSNPWCYCNDICAYLFTDKRHTWQWIPKSCCQFVHEMYVPLLFCICAACHVITQCSCSKFEQWFLYTYTIELDL